MTFSNGRPVILASSMSPDQLSLYPGGRPLVACPDCGRLRVWRRGMLVAHNIDQPGQAGTRRCRGSGQRIRLDVSPAEWLRQMQAAAGLAARRACAVQLPHTHRRTAVPPLLRA
jgi:hypothetical protein